MKDTPAREEAFEKAVDQCNEIAGPGDQSRRLFELGIEQGESFARQSILKEMEPLLNDLRIPHDTCEDGWYSCPKSEEGCANDDAGTDCNCGADRHNAQVDKAIAKMKGEGV